MGDLYIKGKQVSGTTNNASAVTCIDKDGNQSTVQSEINKLHNKEINLPFEFGIDENGNYGYIKEGADSVTPFNQMVKGTSDAAGYSTATKVTLGFKPRAVFAYCKSGGGYLLTWFYAEDLINTRLIRSGSTSQDENKITIYDDGFSWTSVDSSWGSQTITYVAIR